MAIFKKKNMSLDISLPKERTVHGILVRKVPVGRYIEVMRNIEDLPELLLKELFKGKEPVDIFSELMTIDESTLIALFVRAIIVLPEHIVRLLAEILEADEQALLNLTPAELVEVIKAYWELNDMTAFFGNVLGLVKAKLPARITGFSGGSPSGKASGSAKEPS